MSNRNRIRNEKTLEITEQEVENTLNILHIFMKAEVNMSMMKTEMGDIKKTEGEFLEMKKYSI